MRVGCLRLLSRSLVQPTSDVRARDFES